MSVINTGNPAFPTDPSRWSSIIAAWVKSVKEHGGAVIGPVKIPSAPSGPGGSPGGSNPGGGSPSGGDAGGGEDGGGDDGDAGDEGSGNGGSSGNDTGGSSGSASPTSVPSGGGGGSPSGGDDGDSGSSTSPPSDGGGSGGGNVTSTSGNSNNGGGGGVNPTSIPPSGNHNTTIPEGSNDTGDSGASNTAPSPTADIGHTSSTSQGETFTSQPPPLSSPTSSPGQTSNLSTTPFTQSIPPTPTDGISPSTPNVPPGAVSHARARNVNVIAIVLPIVIVLLLLAALLAFFLFRRRQLRRQRNGIRFDDDPDEHEPAPRPRGGATTPSPADYPADPIPATVSGESSFILRHPFAAAYHASSGTLDSAHPEHQFTSGSVIGSGNFSFASAHQGHGSTPADININDPFADPYNVLRERHRALLANAAMWTPASAMSGSGTSYFGESSTGAVEDASRQDLAPGRSDVHLAPPPPPSAESRSHSPHT